MVETGPPFTVAESKDSNALVLFSVWSYYLYSIWSYYLYSCPMDPFLLSLARLQKQVTPGHRLTDDTARALHACLHRLCAHLMPTLVGMASTPQTVLDVSTLEKALGVLFPPGLAQLSMLAGTTALGRAQQTHDAFPSTRQAWSRRAELVLPVTYVSQALAAASPGLSGHTLAPELVLYWTAVLEFLLTDLLESAAEATSSGRRKAVTLHDLYRTVWGDTAPLACAPQCTSFFSGNTDLRQLAQRVQWTVDLH